MMVRFVCVLICLCSAAHAQRSFPHPQAHAHNDYDHAHPLFDALRFGFTSVEADVHLKNGRLLVAHNGPAKDTKNLQILYLAPLDSLLRKNGGVIFPGYNGTFYLMIDCKTDAVDTYQAIARAVSEFPALLCKAAGCPVKIFLSGNRPMNVITKEGYKGIALDGRPEDLGKGFSTEMMPVISDHYSNWSGWKGETAPSAHELDRIRSLAELVHAEGKKLRLWAIPDHRLAWAELSKAGVDLINTDNLAGLDTFLRGQ